MYVRVNMSVTSKKGVRTRYSNALKDEINAQDTEELKTAERVAREYNIHEIYDGLTNVGKKLESLRTKYDKLEAANVDLSNAIDDDEAQTTAFEIILDNEAPLMTKANDLIARFKTMEKRLETRETQLIAEAAAHDGCTCSPKS